MAVKGLGNMAADELKFEIEQGGRFVVYQYCFSALVLTVREPTDIYFVRGKESRLLKGLPWTLMTFLFGWWGIPWGPIYTVGCIWKNLHGGEDVTADILLKLNIGYVDLYPEPMAAAK